LLYLGLMKEVAKNLVAAILGWQVRRLQKKNNLKIIAVAGSIGKTSTKLAIANVLSTKLQVRHQDGNYNDPVTVPLVFFGEPTPSLFNPLSWLVVFWRNERQISDKYPYEIVVLELGTDGPNQISQFKKYLNLEIAVVTAITPEHMEFFSTIDAVAKEELSVSAFSTLLLANKDLCSEKYLSRLSDVLTYGIHKPADYMLKSDGSKALVTGSKGRMFDLDVTNKTEAELYSILAAAAVAHKLGMQPEEIKKGIKNIKPVAGRMQRLTGVNKSIIIDDTYNASPEAVRLALSSLYKMDSPQRIAVLGNMNELGASSEEEHRKIGEYCDPDKLNLVLTLGPDANEYLAPAAEANGCKVISFDNPYTVGGYLKPIIKPGAIILAKGSQNRVFAEEAVKVILADLKDEVRLVRQSQQWLKIKHKQFGDE
jgi:UDP-N-acetylmuramoyl-tripeptide--D-alanyl-D-alanine ligase